MSNSQAQQLIQLNNTITKLSKAMDALETMDILSSSKREFDPEPDVDMGMVDSQTLISMINMKNRGTRLTCDLNISNPASNLWTLPLTAVRGMSIVYMGGPAYPVNVKLIHAPTSTVLSQFTVNQSGIVYPFLEDGGYLPCQVPVVERGSFRVLCSADPADEKKNKVMARLLFSGEYHDRQAFVDAVNQTPTLVSIDQRRSLPFNSGPYTFVGTGISVEILDGQLFLAPAAPTTGSSATSSTASSSSETTLAAPSSAEIGLNEMEIASRGDGKCCYRGLYSERCENDATYGLNTGRPLAFRCEEHRTLTLRPLL